jgi:photosystem II stability/assembly factor-like uncharacterized protein
MTRQPTPDLLDLAEAVAAGFLTLTDAQQGLGRSDATELGRLVSAVSAVRAHAQATRAAASERLTVVLDRPAAGVSLPMARTGPTDAVVAGQPVRGGPVRLGGVRPERGAWGAARWILVAATIALAGGLVAATAFIGSRVPPARPATTPNGLVAVDASASPTAISTPAPTSPPNPAAVGPDVLGDLSTVEMMTATVGWGTTSQAILRTDDGGRTWTAVHASRGNFTRFVDDSTAAFLGPSPFDTIVTTHDGGRTWHTATITPPAKGEPLQLAFASATTGFATFWLDLKGGPMVAFRTDDGGSTWTGPVAGHETGLPSYPSGPEAQGGDSGLIWSTPGKADNQPFDNRFSLSADGGATWGVRPFPSDSLAPAAEQKDLASIRSDGTGHLVMVLRDIPAIFGSQDDGMTWTRVRAWSRPVIVELRSMTGWTAVAWDGSSIDTTKDGGATWRHTVAAQPISIARKFGNGVDFTFGSPDVGLLLDTAQREVCRLESMQQSPNSDPSCAPGQALSVLRATSDGGRTWTQLVP